jgi:hypothetical protein
MRGAARLRLYTGVKAMGRHWLVPSALLAAFCLASPAQAQFYFDTYNMTIPTQSDFNGSDSLSYSNTFSQSWNTDPNLGPGVSCPVSIPGIGCTSGYYGWNFNLATSGQVGVGVQASVSGGTIAATLPFTGYVDYSPNGPLGLGGAPTLIAQTNLTQNGTQASITLGGPGVSASVTGILAAAVSAQATACFVECTSGGGTIVPSFSTTFPIIAVNSANTKVLSIGGYSVGLSGINKPSYININGTPQSSLNPLPNGYNIGQYQLNTPTNLSGGATTGLTTATFTSNQDIFNLSLSLPGLLENLFSGALGADYLKDSFNIPGVISAKYNLFDIEAGLDFGLEQATTLTTSADVWTEFSQPVTWSYQQYSYTSCSGNTVLTIGGQTGPVPFSGDCNDPLIQNFCQTAILQQEGGFAASCTQSPVYTTISQDATNGWIDLPPALQGIPITLSWDNGVPGTLIDRLYQLDPTEATTVSDLTITPDLNISALCASISLVHGLYSGTVPCAYQEDYTATPITVDLATVTQTLKPDCSADTINIGSGSPPFICPPPDRNLASDNGATPDSTVAAEIAMSYASSPNPNDITSGPDPNYQVAPEPPGVALFAFGLIALAGARAGFEVARQPGREGGRKRQMTGSKILSGPTGLAA